MDRAKSGEKKGRYTVNPMPHLLKLPIIRHARAFLLILQYNWRAVMIWGISDPQEKENNPLFVKARTHAQKVWDGEE